MWFSSEIWRDDRDRTARKQASWARGEKPPRRLVSAASPSIAIGPLRATIHRAHRKAEAALVPSFQSFDEVLYYFQKFSPVIFRLDGQE